jgi:hypothetical protein
MKEEEVQANVGNVLNKIMAEKSPSFKKEISIQVQEATRTPNRHDPNTLLHSIFWLKQLAQKTRKEYGRL